MEQIVQLKNGLKMNVHYEKAQGPTVLFLHFSGGTLQMWNGVIPLFENEYQIVAPDIRGHGKSDKPQSGYHIDVMANDLYLLLQELNIAKCHIVGSSMGAEVGLSLAAAHPDMVESLVCEGAIYNEFGEYGLFKGSEQEIEAEKERRRIQLKERTLAIYQTKSAYIEETSKAYIEHGHWNEHFQTYIESTAAETAEGTYTNHFQNVVRSEYIQKYWELRFEDYYKKVRCPVLFLPSEKEWEDEKIRESLTAFASFLESYEIIHIKESAHAFVWLDQPRNAGEVVKDFIQKHTGAWGGDR
ncbi:alpha/beta fold hydrolase [Brevibacillus migulae]|uniref:alpha/beta fold hydrolase n=1 Tax=Brevibacillus migulae TaxID=1644114 RepID=UPI00106EE4C8|nr:alpha/beta hydrolase [Brevibacillus migulae]